MSLLAPSTLDHTLGALADPTRRAILQRLVGGETRVTDVAGRFAISLNAVSKHIRVLERAGLVRRRRAGREHLLSLDAAPLDEAAAWIATQHTLWTARLNRLESLLEAEDQAASSRPVNPQEPTDDHADR